MTDRKRRWFYWLSTASVALAAGCLFMLARTLVVSDTLIIGTPGGAWQFQTHRGGLFIMSFDMSIAGGMVPVGKKSWITESPATARPWPEWNVRQWDDAMLLGFGLQGAPAYSAARMPIVYLIAMFAVLPVWWWRHPFRKVRPFFGKCIKCGYDLRASSDRCPECGEPFAAAKSVTPAPPAKVR